LAATKVAIGTAQVQRANVSLASRGGVRCFNAESSSEAVARIRKHLLARPVLVQPAPHAIGVVAPTTVIEYSVFFSTHAKISDDLVYSIANAIHGGKDDMIKFYKEIGQWPPKG
jgi:hypothetical protein